jgi:uncharacterized membrane protein (UPF0127 family)
MKLKIRNKTIEAEVADNSITHFFGLSFSKKKNLLFKMHYEKRWRLWMFGVKFPLKMIFMNKDKVVVDIKNAVPITLDLKTWKIYRPKKPCKYILETPHNLDVKIGDKINFK